MKIDLAKLEVYMIRWALIKFAAASEPKVADKAMEIYDKLGKITPEKR